jgi:hypothetical protein
MTKSLKKSQNVKQEVDMSNAGQVQNSMHRAVEPSLPDGVELVSEPIRDGNKLRIIVEGYSPDSVTSRQTLEYVIMVRNECGYSNAGLDPINGYYYSGQDSKGKNLYRKDFVFTAPPI